MNVKIEQQEEDTSANQIDLQIDLLAGCSYLVENAGERSLAATFLQLEEGTGPTGKKDTLKKVIEAARHEGLQSRILRPQGEKWSEVVECLPVIAELRNGRYLIVSGIDLGNDGVPAAITAISQSEGEGHNEQTFYFTDFQKHSTGGLLRFEKINTALVCFSIVAREHKIELTQDRLRHEYNLGYDEIPQDTLLRMSKDHGLRARVLKLDWSGLLTLKKAYPAIARLHNGRHVVVAGAIPDNPEQEATIACYDPLNGSGGGHLRMTREEFAALWTGEIYILKRVYKLSDETQPFSLRWFIPEILRQRTAFVDIAIAVLFINAIALVTPIFFQIVIDKVLVNQAFTTLHVLGFGMTVMLVVNGCLDFLRDYLLLHATNKIDLRVTSRTFRHMLNLPLDFFERVTAGVLTKHMQQTSNIRGFLTGSVFLTMLEATSLFVFLPFLFFYSFQLTAIVLVFTLLIAAVILVLIAPFKRRLNALYDAEGCRQAMLVETINGMPTVKAMAIEPLLRSQWEQKVARAISMQFRVGKISITASL